MNGLRVRTVSTSLGEWISSGNEWSQSPCHPVSGSTCPGLAIGVWCGKGTAPGCAWCLRGPCFCVVFVFLAWPCTGSPKVPSGLIAQAHEVLDFDSVYIITDNRDLVSSEVESQPGLAHWPAVAAWWSERISNIWDPIRRKQQFSLCPFVLIRDSHLSTQRGRALSSWTPVYTSSLPSILPLLTVTASRSLSLKLKSYDDLAIACRSAMRK